MERLYKFLIMTDGHLSEKRCKQKGRKDKSLPHAY